MGSMFSSLFNFTSEKRVLMLGLDGAGKTTILYKLKLGEVRETVPTIGFNVEKIKYKKIEFNVWDIGGQDKIRPLWKHYYSGINALIFVIDVNDHDRLSDVIHELRILVDDELSHVPLLIYLNKCDLPNRIKHNDILIELAKFMKHQNYYLQLSCAKTDEGLYEGLDWLNKELMKKKSK